MNVKGGVAYIDLDNKVLFNRDSNESVYINGIYNSIKNAVNSSKVICVVNFGDNKIPVIFSGVLTTSRCYILRYNLLVESNNVVYLESRYIYVFNDDRVIIKSTTNIPE